GRPCRCRGTPDGCPRTALRRRGGSPPSRAAPRWRAPPTPGRPLSVSRLELYKTSSTAGVGWVTAASLASRPCRARTRAARTPSSREEENVRRAHRAPCRGAGPTTAEAWSRSEERRVGKECGCEGARDVEEK